MTNPNQSHLNQPLVECDYTDLFDYGERDHISSFEPDGNFSFYEKGRGGANPELIQLHSRAYRADESSKVRINGDLVIRNDENA